MDLQELGDLCESFVSCEKDIEQLAEKYEMSTAAVDQLLRCIYYGYVPKENQITITIRSKV